MTERKTVVITGANAGIGLATAQSLAAKGYNVVTVCRDKSKGDATAVELIKANPGIQAENFTADLSDLGAVQKIGNAIASKYGVIDRLINNAGYYPSAIEYIGDTEKTLFTSHLGHMLLTQLLIPSLQRSVEARIITVSSALQHRPLF
ncbi:MAG: SDR family NAD(P)-dependent oxidoreductase [Bacteroidia bacterium]|nr:SDR family NAD(P)-dependent oxidoreductase [Bacteroidia bacterium]